MDDGSLFIGCAPRCLDFSTLEARWFCAVWSGEERRRTVRAFWFADARAAAVARARAEFPAARLCAAGEQAARECYQALRRRRTKAGGPYRLARLSAFRAPWREVPPGWYALCSRGTYPCYVAAVRRGRWSVRIRHISLCETPGEAAEFLREVSALRRTRLTLLANAVFQPGHTR